MTSRSRFRELAYSRVCLRVDRDAISDPVERREAADRICAVCWEAGAVGLEECADEDGISLFIYALDSDLEAALAAGIAAGGRQHAESESVANSDWSKTWKAGFEAIEVSHRLVVRATFVDFAARAGQREIVIDPGQAFGTGSHASTRLALEWIDRLHGEFEADTRVLDIGTGTGVLAFAALGLGAGQAVGFDIDPLAAIEAKQWAEHNGLSQRFAVYAGGIEALGGQAFDLVLANLLRRELLPIVPQIAGLTQAAGQLVLSGLLAEERDKVEETMMRFGFETRAERVAGDANGDRWMSLLMARA